MAWEGETEVSVFAGQGAENPCTGGCAEAAKATGYIIPSRGAARGRQLRKDAERRSRVKLAVAAFVVDPARGGFEHDQGGDQRQDEQDPGHRAGVAHAKVLERVLVEVEGVE